MKKAVVYYSLSGNTKEAAEKIAKGIGADLIHVDQMKAMPESKATQMFLGGMKATFGMKPQIKGVPENIKEYDEIIIGTPIWANKPAPAMNTFLLKYEIKDKVSAVFTFSGGGDNDKCIEYLSKILPNMKTEVALADREHKLAEKNNEKIDSFIKKIGV